MVEGLDTEAKQRVQDLRIVLLPLNQNEPSVIKVGTRGITTMEFPSKIEALDGFGFRVNPALDGPDVFQISFNKGTNFLSLKAIKEGVEGNLTVVLASKVYSLFCKSADDPVFVVIFEGGGRKRTTNSWSALIPQPEALTPISPAQSPEVLTRTATRARCEKPPEMTLCRLKMFDTRRHLRHGRSRRALRDPELRQQMLPTAAVQEELRSPSRHQTTQVSRAMDSLAPKSF